MNKQLQSLQWKGLYNGFVMLLRSAQSSQQSVCYPVFNHVLVCSATFKGTSKQLLLSWTCSLTDLLLHAI